MYAVVSVDITVANSTAFNGQLDRSASSFFYEREYGYEEKAGIEYRTDDLEKSYKKPYKSQKGLYKRKTCAVSVTSTPVSH
jgi:hypothetical protein